MRSPESRNWSWSQPPMSTACGSDRSARLMDDWMMAGVHWNLDRASIARGASLYDSTSCIPLSPSRTPLFGMPGAASRSGIGSGRKMWLPTIVSVQA
jgi:hypothetical protein